MLTDLVIDTNVLVIENNDAAIALSRESHNLIRALLEPTCSTALRIDAGFDADPARNRSKIAAEYEAWLVPGMLGHQLIQHLAASQRVVEVEERMSRHERRKLKRVVLDGSDCIFVEVAAYSEDRVLVSHDEEAFTINACQTCLTEWGVRVVEAIDALEELS